MSATTTEQETPQAEQDTPNAEQVEQAEPTIEQRLDHLEAAFAEQICESMKDALQITILKARVARLERQGQELRESMPAPIYGELVTSGSDNVHMRISTKQTAKAFQFETAVSVDGPDATDVRERVEQLLYQTNNLAREECQRLDVLERTPVQVAAEQALADRRWLADSSGDEPDIAR